MARFTAPEIAAAPPDGVANVPPVRVTRPVAGDGAHMLSGPGATGRGKKK
jgi:hypothetical protein